MAMTDTYGQLSLLINKEHQIVTVPFEIHIKLIEQPKVMANVTARMENLINIQKKNLRKMNEFLNRNSNNYQNLKRITKQIQDDMINNELEVLEKLKEIQTRLDELNSKHMFTPNENSLAISKKVVINGNVSIRTMKTHHINLKFINTIEWNPHKWLSQETSQNVTCATKFQTIFTNNLQLNSFKNDLFNNLLLQSGNQVISGSMEFRQNLQAFHVNVNVVNGIPFNKIVTSKNSNLLISGTKSFQNLHVNRLNIVNWNKLNIEDTPNKLDVDTIFISSDLRVTNNIEVTNINGLPFNKLMRSMFLRDVDTEIIGNLSFAVPFMATRIHTNSISNIRVSELMTTNTLQNISTNIVFKSINTPNIHCRTINGISLRENAAKTNEDNQIIGPVSTLHLNLTGNLSLNGEFEQFDWANNNENHVIGTEESDLLQIYTEPVVIRGNLVLKNLQYLNKTRLNIHGAVWNTNFKDDFLLKNTNQEIQENILFERGFTVPYLVVNKINNIPTALIVNDTFNEQLWPILPTQFYFKHLKILGNLTIYPLFYQNIFHQSDVRAMAKQAVKLNGVYKLSGPKIFKEKLFIKNLQVQYINDEPVLKTFKNISVSNIHIMGDLILANTSSTKINEISNPKLYDSNIPKHLNMEKIQCKNIQIENLNGYPLENLLKILNKELPLNKLVIHGNVFVNNLTTKQIQNFSMSNFDQIVQKNGTVLVSGRKTFQNLKIYNLESNNLNGVSFENMVKNVLSRKRPQNIRGKYTFTNIRTPSIITEKIDGIQTDQLLSTSNPEMQYFNTSLLRLHSAHVQGSIHPKLIHGSTVPEHIQVLQNVPAINCRQLFVNGNIVVPEDSKLYEMLNNSILSDKDYYITSPVNFKNRVLIQNLHSNRYINRINLSSIENDALFRDRQNQIISGMITFTNNLFANSIRVFNDSRIPFVNYINLEKFNEKLVRIQDERPISGVKTFLNDIYSRSLQIPDKIHGINPDVLVSYKRNRIIPSTQFQNLTISNNLFAHEINRDNFTDFLNSRMLLSSKIPQDVWQTFQFENINLSGQADIMSINDVLLENVVTDTGIQNVFSPKEFSKSIETQMAVNIDILNNVPIKDAYQYAIFTDENATIDGNIMFDNTVLMDSNIKANSLNGLTWKQLMDNIQNINMSVPELTTRVQSKLDNGMKLTTNMASRYLYLEEIIGVIEMPEMDTKSATIDYYQNTMTFNLIGERNGNECHLSANCSCATQYSFQLNDFGQIEPISGVGFERVYRFVNDENLIINVITNTISYHEFCRSNKIENEISHIVWFETMNGQNREANNNDLFTFDPNHISGYLSDVKYFQSRGEMYIVLARFYDPQNNSHDIDCLVLKLSTQTQNTTLIQTIRGYGASTLEILGTDQGIVLVIGNTQYVNDHTKRIDSGIYRFSEIDEQFQLLRNVSSRNGITGISSENLNNGQSVIIFAQSESNLAVYKYHRKFDNYYFYQFINLESETIHANLFYLGEPQKSDLFLTIVTNDSKFSLYKYNYMEGFRLETIGDLENYL
ncbi:uncharacterized protein LOC123303063 [Chrysoperla carnea]|uniref:uncharacterized protein LOC123303063 n=1 Tax=Chrysoperla carnea TaxID=189513 RepID=UPI001D06673A|nr:uncharacterized protein LOC123303063 [Chrysoperla carnea]